MRPIPFSRTPSHGLAVARPLTLLAVSVAAALLTQGCATDGSGGPDVDTAEDWPSVAFQIASAVPHQGSISLDDYEPSGPSGQDQDLLTGQIDSQVEGTSAVRFIEERVSGVDGADATCGLINRDAAFTLGGFVTDQRPYSAWLCNVTWNDAAFGAMAVLDDGKTSRVGVILGPDGTNYPLDLPVLSPSTFS